MTMSILPTTNVIDRHMDVSGRVTVVRMLALLNRGAMFPPRARRRKSLLQL